MKTIIEKQGPCYISGMSWFVESESALDPRDISFIESFSPSIFHNDIECYLWAFDEKLPSGSWLENMRFSNDLHTATAHIYS